MPGDEMKESSAPDPIASRSVSVALAIFLPSAFGFAMAGIGAEAAPEYLPLRAFGLMAPILAASFSAVLSLVLERERASVWGHIRGFILFFLLLWPLQALLMRRAAGIDFRPDPAGVFLMAESVFAYVFAAKLRGSFHCRELFMASVRGLRGDALRKAAREDGGLSQEAVRNMGGASSSSLGFLAFLGTAIFLVSLAKKAISPFLAVSFTVFLASVLILMAIIADFRQSHALLCMGVLPRIEDRVLRARLATIAVAIICVAAPFVSGESPLLPYRVIAGFLEFLFKPRGSMRPVTRNPAAPDLWTGITDFQAPSEIADYKPLVDLSLFYKIAGRLMLAAAILAFILFLVSPLLSKYLKDFFKARRPGKAFASFIEFLKSVISLLRLRPKAAPRGLSAADRKRMEKTFEGMARRRRDPEKERETGKMTKAFVGLIARGTELGRPYLPSSVPAEWAGSLAAVWPEETPEGEELVLAAEIFEEALYSAKLVGKERAEEYFEILKRARSR
jgi:hypothetical protein